MLVMYAVSDCSVKNRQNVYIIAFNTHCVKKKKQNKKKQILCQKWYVYYKYAYKSSIL